MYLTLNVDQYRITTRLEHRDDTEGEYADTDEIIVQIDRYQDDGKLVRVGRGWWDDAIIDCDADLGDDVYAKLEDAIRAELSR